MLAPTKEVCTQILIIISILKFWHHPNCFCYFHKPGSWSFYTLISRRWTCRNNRIYFTWLCVDLTRTVASHIENVIFCLNPVNFFFCHYKNVFLGLQTHQKYGILEPEGIMQVMPKPLLKRWGNWDPEVKGYLARRCLREIQKGALSIHFSRLPFWLSALHCSPQLPACKLDRH